VPANSPANETLFERDINKKKEILPRRRKGREDVKNKIFFSIQNPQAFLRDLRALAVQGFWFQLVEVRGIHR
jgi:hypothetical protein